MVVEGALVASGLDPLGAHCVDSGRRRGPGLVGGGDGDHHPGPGPLQPGDHRRVGTAEGEAHHRHRVRFEAVQLVVPPVVVPTGDDLHPNRVASGRRVAR